MIKTPKISDVTTNVTNGLVIVGGGLLGRGATSYIPEAHQTIGKAGVAVGSMIGAAAIKGNSRGASMGKLALIGVAAFQLIDLATDLAKKNIKPTNVQFIDKALGLTGCGCNGGLGLANFGFLSQPSADTGVHHINWEAISQDVEEEKLPLMM